ncbi:hypothetical protein ABKV19_001087 [Rosa sericea]
MKISHLCLFLSLLLFGASSLCHADDHKTVEVVGFGECTDCAEKSIKTSHAFSGLGVTIDCKAESGHFERRGASELNEEGKFSVSIPKEIVKDGGDGLKEECYAQLHNAKATPCAAHDGLESTKVVFKSKNSDGKQTFGIVGTKLKFSPSTCTSAFFWPHFKHPLPKWTKPHPLFGHPIFPFPPKKFPPFPPKITIPPFYKKPLPPPVPIYEKSHSLHQSLCTRSHSHHQFQCTKSRSHHQFQCTQNRFHHRFLCTQNRSHHQSQCTQNHSHLQSHFTNQSHTHGSSQSHTHFTNHSHLQSHFTNQSHTHGSSQSHTHFTNHSYLQSHFTNQSHTHGSSQSHTHFSSTHS